MTLDDADDIRVRVALRRLAEHGDAPSRLLAGELLQRWEGGWRPDAIEEDDDGNTVLVVLGPTSAGRNPLPRSVNRIVLPVEPECPAVDDWTARFLAALDLGAYPPLPTDFVPGEPVVLTLFGDGEEVVGRFVACFDDDDPEDGNGPTFRILGDDLQVWEGRACRPRSVYVKRAEIPAGVRYALTDPSLPHCVEVPVFPEGFGVLNLEDPEDLDSSDYVCKIQRWELDWFSRARPVFRGPAGRDRFDPWTVLVTPDRFNLREFYALARRRDP